MNKIQNPNQFDPYSAADHIAKILLIFRSQAIQGKGTFGVSQQQAQIVEIEQAIEALQHMTAWSIAAHQQNQQIQKALIPVGMIQHLATELSNKWTALSQERREIMHDFEPLFKELATAIGVSTMTVTVKQKQ